MSDERWRRITDIFHRALAQDRPDRAAFLSDACAGDTALHIEVEALLAAHRDAGAFGDAPIGLTDAGPPTMAGEAADSQPATMGRHPFARVVWAVCVLTVGAFACAAWVLLTGQIADSELGYTEERRAGHWYVAGVDATGPAAGILQPGDRIVRLNGHELVGGPGLLILRRALQSGQPYRLTIERDGHVREMALVARADPDAPGGARSLFVIALGWCVVGLFIGFARPERPSARLAFGAAIATGLAYLGGIGRFAFWQPLHVVVGYHFFYQFPNDRPPGGTWRWLLWMLYGVAAPAAILLAYLQLTLIFAGPGSAAGLSTRYESLFRLRATLVPLVYLGAIGGIVGLLIRNYRRDDEDSRRRIRWVSVASLLAMTSQLGWVAEPALRALIGPGLASLLSRSRATDLITLLIPLSVAYAVVRHRVFDIRVFVRRAVQYLLARRALQAAVAVPLLALSHTLVVNRNRTLAEIVSGSSGYLYWLTAAGIGLKCRRPIHTWLDRKFFRAAYYREQMLLALVDDATRVDSIAQLSELVHAKLQLAFHPSAVYLWYRDPRELRETSSANGLLTPQDFPREGRWLAWLETQAQPVDFPFSADARLSPKDARWFVTHEISLAIPIADSAERLAGVLLVGAKKSDEPYSTVDRQLLQAIAKQASVVRENVRLRARVTEEQRIRVDVLARVDGALVNVLKECPACGSCFDTPLDACERDGTPLTLTLPVARTIDGKYRIDRLIGKGGMGAVYEARDLRLARTVAIKIMLGRTFGDAAALRRFQREARAAGQLNHPNIVSVYDFGSLDGEGAYLVLERVNGVTLREELTRHGALSPPLVAEWFAPLLDGLAAAHAHGIVHRDLKPENVIGQRDGARLGVKILDFGLAKCPGGELPSGTVTADGLAIGTLGYMSPEQLLAHDVDARADIFAVGVMLVEALTGSLPFTGASIADASRAALHDQYVLPKRLAPADAIIQRCLAKEREHRIASAARLRSDLLIALDAAAVVGSGHADRSGRHSRVARPHGDVNDVRDVSVSRDEERVQQHRSRDRR